MNQSRLISPVLEDIRRALAGPLPGIEGQIKMAPQLRADQVNRWETPDNYREASVLLLLYPHTTNGWSGPELHVVLTRRPEYPGAHSGQISLPGGRREGDESLQTTALREVYEEIGLAPSTIEVIGQLSPLYTPPSNFYIYPFIGYSAARPAFQPDAKEVAELIEAPLSLLQNPASHKEEIWHFPNYGERRVPFFDVFGHHVWGATAMILSEFLILLQCSRAAPLPDNRTTVLAV
jgi:8-oxo-dGTP pyrophosphatase MutT (NUDIX family)